MEDQHTIISVLMTAYNREAYIANAIESVLASSFTNFELIVVDDCSSDNTVAIVKSLVEKDSRIRLYVNDKNYGDYKNRNIAAAYANGKYLKYLDSDDFISPHGLMVMLEAIEKFPQAAMAMMWIYDSEKNTPILYSSKEALEEYFNNNRWLMLGPSGCIYNRKIFNDIGGFSGINYIGDFEFNMKCALRYPIVRIPNNLVYFSEHEDRQSHNPGHGNTFRNHLFRIQKTVLKDPNCELSEHDKNKALQKIIKMQSRRILFYFFKSMKLKYCLKLIHSSELGWINFIKGLITI